MSFGAQGPWVVEWLLLANAATFESKALNGF